MEELIRTVRHAIQFVQIGTEELRFKALRPVDRLTTIPLDTVEITWRGGEFDEATKRYKVYVRVHHGTAEQADTPAEFAVEIYGEFNVDVDRFEVKHLQDWGKRNAIMLLMPYMRELVYALTARAGIAPVIIPLAEIPMTQARPEPTAVLDTTATSPDSNLPNE